MRRFRVWAAVAMLCSAGASAPPDGAVAVRIWLHVDGGSITDTLATDQLKAAPTQARSVAGFELDPAPPEPQACDLAAEVTAPKTGSYTFFISGDDTALLFLSTDESAARRQVIASVPVVTGHREYHKFASQTSKPIALIAGHRYLLEAVLKNANGDSHVSVGWQMPDGTVEAPIPAARLSAAPPNLPLPTYRADQAKVTLRPADAPAKTFGFTRFVGGAHAEFPDKSIDVSYLMFLPHQFTDASGKVPLLIFLHGNGHQGTNLDGAINEATPYYLDHDKALADWFPMVGLFPQLPPDWRWDTPGAASVVSGLIRGVCDKYPRIDRNRIYLTGLSMGGKGTWLTALDSPELFAAVTPMSAVSVQPNVAKARLAGLKNLHIICGGDDGDFAAGSKEMYAAIKPVMGSRVQLTVVPRCGHDVWNRYCPTREFYEEFLKFSR
jgi:pimeloyl-ACP methyl ester carboxylesterase